MTVTVIYSMWYDRASRRVLVVHSLWMTSLFRHVDEGSIKFYVGKTEQTLKVLVVGTAL